MCWCGDRLHIRKNFRLHANKTRTSYRQVAKFDQSDGILVSEAMVRFIMKLGVLGLTLDIHLSFDKHVTGLVCACNYHMRALRHIRQLIDQDKMNIIACSIVFTRLDWTTATPYSMKFLSPASVSSCAQRHTNHRQLIYNSHYTGCRLDNAFNTKL